MGLKRRARSEELFWELWYESYQECFYGKKRIKIP
nr:MAG TPA: arginine decarboxylase [Bacteriophage sp.]